MSDGNAFGHLVRGGQFSDHAHELQAKLRGLVSSVSWTPATVAELCAALLKRFDSQVREDGVGRSLWLLKMLHCIEMNHVTPGWRSGKTLLELIRDPSTTDDQLTEVLDADPEKTLDEIIEEVDQQMLVDKKVLDDTKEIVSAVANSQVDQIRERENRRLGKVLERLNAAVKKRQTIAPRLTQMVSWALMALSTKGRLIQVSTGEGKTCIVAMFAAFKALEGQKVDIMSSSPVLAERDFEQWQSFYKELKISVSCNINKSNADCKKCYECQVVYGTAQEFAADWLRQHFGRQDIRPERPFQCTIVDEVDSLMLDKGAHTVYLSNDMPALLHLNSLLAHIWTVAHQYTTEASFRLGPTALFHHVAIECLAPGEGDHITVLKLAESAGLVEKDSVEAFKQDPSVFSQVTMNLTPEKLEAFFKLIELQYKTCHFVLYKKDNGSLTKLEEVPQNNESQTQISLLLLSKGVCQYLYQDQESVQRAAKTAIMSTLHFTPCDVRHRTTDCYVPGFLRGLVESKIETWIENAFHAQILTMDHQYVIERHGVVPVDYRGTGVLENNMQWTDGLHQFLQMKHHNKLSNMSAITNYMSNVGLLQMYGDQIYGVTGTLGQRAEIEAIQRIYSGISTVCIPTFKRRKLFEVEGEIVNNEEEWLQTICHIIRSQVSSTAYRSARAVLVICETISRAKAINKALGPFVLDKNLYISNNVDNRAITDHELKAGQVIIATNLAGRGMDLRVRDAVKKAGGLFVLQTFLPVNARVEAQAFGRTGRQGSSGSAQLIICSTHLPQTLQRQVQLKSLQFLLRDVFSLLEVLSEMGLRNIALSETLSRILTRTSIIGINMVKTVRDESVAKDLKSFLENQIPKMTEQQELFRQYLDFIDDFYRENNNEPSESDVSALHEFWCLWLLINDKDSGNALKKKLAADLEGAKESLRQRQSPLSNLHHYTQFGTELLTKGRFEASIQMFTKAIDQDSCWAAIAFYNRALARLLLQDNNQDMVCIEQALQDLRHSLNSIELYCHQNDIVYKFSKPHLKGVSQAAFTRFDHHQNVKCKVFQLFRQNIEEAIMKLTKAKRTGHVKVATHHVQYLALVDYLQVLIHLVESVGFSRSINQLRTLQINNDSAFDILHEFESLKSLGLTCSFVLDTRFSLLSFLSRITQP